MQRTRLNFITDVIAFIGFVLLTTTGILMHYLLPPGSGYASTMAGLNRHEWGQLHFWTAIILFGVLTLHLVLHARWIISVVRGRPHQVPSYRLVLGVTGLLALIALSIGLLVSPVKTLETQSSYPHAANSVTYSNLQVSGTMTLLDIEKTNNVPASYLITALNLPDSISREDSLADLKIRYGFKIGDVKKAIKKYHRQK